MRLTETITLHNEFVRLEPLTLDHASDLADATVDLEHAWYTSVPTPATIESDIAQRLQWQADGTMNAWAVCKPETGKTIGMTTFCNIDEANRHVEIGHTWIAVSAQRTAVNTAMKLLLLTHAFERCDAIAVEFRTHWHNRQSREAIARLGAKQDGVLRNHKLGPDGTLRDTVVFSIVPSEWPAVRLGINERLSRG